MKIIKVPSIAGRILRGATALASILLLAGFWSCGNGDGNRARISSEEEEQVFDLVYVPGAEGRYADAIAVSDSLLSHCEMGDTLKAYVMIERMVALANSGALDRSSAYADTLIDFGRKIGLNEAVMQGEQTKGVAYRRNSMPDSAAACYTRGMNVSIADGNIEMEQVFCDMLAILYCETSRFTEAGQFAVRAKELAQEMSDTTAIISSDGTLGSILIGQGKYSEAAATLGDNIGILDGAAPILKIKYLTPLLQAQIALGSLGKAEKTLQRMETACASLPVGHQSHSVTLTGKAALLGKQGRYEEQWHVFEKLDSLGSHGKSAESQLQERARCLAGMGRWKEAYGKMQEAFAAVDSVRHVDLEHELSDMSVRYDTLAKEMEIGRLHHKSHVLWLSIAILTVVIALVVIAAIDMRRRARLRSEFDKQKEYIRGLEDERSRIARELHDGIAGDLVGLQYALAALHADEGAELASQIAGDVRRLSHELMPPEFTDYPLTSLLLSYVGNHNRHHEDQRITLTDEGSFAWEQLSPAISRQLYRMVQEGVANAMKHAPGMAIKVTLDGIDRFVIVIENSLAENRGDYADDYGIGMRTLEKRASMAGARIETSTEDNKFRLIIRQI